MTYSINTRVVHGDNSYDISTGAISFPIYQSATFRHPALHESTGFDYSRETNPTRQKVEKTIAILEGGEEGFAFSTGMAAIDNLFQVFSPGDHILVSNDLYGGTYRLFEKMYKKYGLSFTYIDTSKTINVREGTRENTRGIFIETPTNPMMRISNIREICDFAVSKNILTIVDNTFLTPYYQRPLELGADVVIHSGTKFLGGHNDLLSGLLVVKEKGELAEQIRLIQKTLGGVLAPFDSWLLLRGMKTLGIRMDKQQESAFKIAHWLKENKNVKQVYYPGLLEHEGHEVCKNQASGFGAMISFTVQNVEMVEKILKDVKLIAFAESLGGVETLITYPMIQTHASIPVEILNTLGVTNTLLRLSVGIESAEDIIKDLEYAMEG